MSTSLPSPDLPRDHVLHDGTVVRLREVAAEDGHERAAPIDAFRAELGPGELTLVDTTRYTSHRVISMLRLRAMDERAFKSSPPLTARHGRWIETKPFRLDNPSRLGVDLDEESLLDPERWTSPIIPCQPSAADSSSHQEGLRCNS